MLKKKSWLEKKELIMSTKESVLAELSGASARVSLARSRVQSDNPEKAYEAISEAHEYLRVAARLLGFIQKESYVKT